MKKCLRILLVFVLASSFALMLTSYASAIPLPLTIVVPDPFAVPSVEGAKITSEVLGVPSLPGTMVLASGKYSPVGYKEGDAQFGGSGLKVSGLEKGVKAKVCFSFRDYSYKWKGVITMWDGHKWVTQKTEFPIDADGVTSWACTQGAGNGTYSLIQWYYGPAEPAPTEQLIG